MTNAANRSECIVDFTSMPDVTLFTGRKNGRKAKKHFTISNADYFIFRANENQVITSSYFLGLVGEELIALLNKLENSNINELLTCIDTQDINTVSQNECVRAIKRGLSSQDDSLL
ncbi:hypothetical protein MW350_001954 [Vibrio parahaemolyticus]|nr:hypothetical protein [Vibrio parahaemolyticus]